MKSIIPHFLLRWFFVALMPILVFVSCKDDEEGFAITNDLRVLQVNIDGSTQQSGVAGLSVISNIELIFSHQLNASAFESALNVSPAVDLSISYDETGSFVTLSPDSRFEYDTEYTVSFAAGTYGEEGEASVENYSFIFSTAPFIAPAISLTPDMNTFFEGETITVVASIDNIIFSDVTFDLNYSGSAEGDGVDYTTSATSITIPAGETSVSFTVAAIAGDDTEGEETIVITLSNVVNGVNDPPLTLTLSLGDTAPALVFKGVMELDNYDPSGDQIRAVHLEVLKEIPDLSIYHIQVASNGAPADPTDIDFAFPAVSASIGENLLIIRDLDAARAATYFGDCYSGFTEFQTGGMTQNGDDAILLYKDGVAIESFGEPGVDGTDQFWEYTNSWAYKFGEEWVYAGAGCAENGAGDGTLTNSLCRYPFCSPGLQFVGIMSLQPNAGRIRAYHLRAMTDIPDLSVFGAGIASNGQATSDGVEINFPAQAASAGEDILLIRNLDVERAAAYFEGCFNTFEHVIPVDGLTSNGDDTIELFKDGSLIETYGELGVDGTGALWDYTDAWAAKISGAWTYGGPGCTAGVDTNSASSCPYVLCD